MDFENMNEILKNDCLGRQSFFQLQCFILGKEPTIQAKLWQCINELKTRKQSLNNITLEIDDQTDRLELLDIDNSRITAQKCSDENDQREKQVKLRKVERQKTAISNLIFELNQKKKNIEDEAMFFITAFEQLSKRESLKQWDDPDVQKEYWNEKLKQEVNVRLLLRQLPDVELMKSIMALHDDSPIKVKTIEMLKTYNKSIQDAQQKGINGG